MTRMHQLLLATAANYPFLVLSGGVPRQYGDAVGAVPRRSDNARQGDAYGYRSGAGACANACYSWRP